MKITSWPTLSLHPAVTAVLQGVLNLVLVWWFPRLPAPLYLGLWWVFALAIASGLSLITYYAPGASRARQLVTLAFAYAGLALLLLVADSPVAWWFTSVLVVMGPAVGWLLLPWEATLTFGLKPERRWRLLLTAFGVLGVWSSARGMIFFQLLSPPAWWLPWLVGTLIVGAVSLWWWWEYGVNLDRRTYLTLGIFLLMMFEITGAAGWLPWGYLTSGVAFTVIWYVGWLLLRFYLSPGGIDWRRQRWLLLGAGATLTGFLAIVRWR
ncbi:MAG: hypothetical protein HYV42_01075 [Candidatus Magasanikbacteria bacterium]|nr:hypothetical protein [Candidatus Magasanikbacteria bacterium]